MADRATGAARRRRERRLRSMLRHERQTSPWSWPAALHHSRDGGRVTNDGLRAQKTASAGLAEYFERSSDDGRPAGGERPAALLEPRPQGRVQRHAEHIIEVLPFVRILVVPVPQLGSRHCDPQGGYRCADDLSGPNPTALCGQASSAESGTVGSADTPNMRCACWWRGPHQRFLPEQASTAPQFAEQIVDIPVSSGGLPSFRPVHGSSASSAISRPADEAFQGGFALFPEGKSAEVARQVSAQLGGDVTSSTLSAHQMAWIASPDNSDDDDPDRQYLVEDGYNAVASEDVWLLGTDIFWDGPGEAAADGRAGG